LPVKRFLPFAEAFSSCLTLYRRVWAVSRHVVEQYADRASFDTKILPHAPHRKARRRAIISKKNISAIADNSEGYARFRRSADGPNS
jgi:hypothetical protein